MVKPGLTGTPAAVSRSRSPCLRSASLPAGGTRSRHGLRSHRRQSQRPGSCRPRNHRSRLRCRPRRKPGANSRPIRPPRRSRRSRHSRPIRPARRTTVHRAHQQQSPRPLGHGVLAPQLAAHAPAGRRPPAPYRQEHRERHRRRHRRDGHGYPDRDEQRGRIKEVPSRPTEHQEYDQQQCRHPARRAGVTDHGQPLIARMPSRVGRAPLPVHFLDPSASGKSQDPASTGCERSVIRASSPAASASPADRYSAACSPLWNAE